MTSKMAAVYNWTRRTGPLLLPGSQYKMAAVCQWLGTKTTLVYEKIMILG